MIICYNVRISNESELFCVRCCCHLTVERTPTWTVIHLCMKSSSIFFFSWPSYTCILFSVTRSIVKEPVRGGEKVTKASAAWLNRVAWNTINALFCRHIFSQFDLSHPHSWHKRFYEAKPIYWADCWVVHLSSGPDSCCRRRLRFIYCDVLQDGLSTSSLPSTGSCDFTWPCFFFKFYFPHIFFFFFLNKTVS